MSNLIGSPYLKRALMIILLSVLNFFLIFSQNNASPFSAEGRCDVIHKPSILDIAYDIHDVTKIRLVIDPGEAPLKINGIQVLKHDTIINPIEPFTATLASKGKNGKNLNWNVIITLPLINRFHKDDILVINTDIGEIRIPATPGLWIKEELKKTKNQVLHLADENEVYIKEADRFRKHFVLFLILSVIFIGVSIWIILLYRRALTKNKVLSEAGNNTRDTYSDPNKTNKTVMNLFQDRFIALNMLCEEYYEKRDSDLLKTSMLKSVLRYIDTMKTKETLLELSNILNAVNNGIITHVKKQIPTLTEQELNFLTYIFSGFSPRTVCVLTNINLNQFYYRRTKIKEAIISSQTPDTEILIARLMKYK